MGKTAGAALLRRGREVGRGGCIWAEEEEEEEEEEVVVGEAAPKYTRQMWAAPIAVHRDSIATSRFLFCSAGADDF